MNEAVLCYYVLWCPVGVVKLDDVVTSWSRTWQDEAARGALPGRRIRVCPAQRHCVVSAETRRHQVGQSSSPPSPTTAGHDPDLLTDRAAEHDLVNQG